MGAIANLLKKQEALESQFKDFLASLDQRRTVTLRQLLTEDTALKTLSAPWLNQKRFAKRIEAACIFFEQLTPHFRLESKRRLVFFQTSRANEDRHEHKKMLAKDSYYAEKYQKRGGDTLPPQYLYLHTNPIWMELVGDWKSGNRQIRPLTGCTNYNWKMVFREFPGRDARANVLGFRVPKWPTLLGVSNDVATDYFARMVIHDLGHEVLPQLNPAIDSLHNAVMIHAMDVHEPTDYKTFWEKIVHKECTDPYFFVDGWTLLEQCTLEDLAPLQRYLLTRFIGWYDSPTHTKHMTWLWDIQPGSSSSIGRATAKKVILEMCADGFQRYDKMK